MPARSTASLRDRLLKLHAEARAAREHHVSYHALAGALHAAESLEDKATCERIERLARQHGEAIDAEDPGHPLSSASAGTRGHNSIFKQLAVMAHSARLRMQVPMPGRKQQGRPKAPLRKAKKPKR